MGRRKTLSDDVGLRRFLLTVHHHPWATPDLIQAYAGLPSRAFRTAQRLALARGLVEQGDLHTAARPARRFGLAPAGAALLGERLSLYLLRDAYLRARLLDEPRALLAEWVHSPGMAWALSPFTLPATALRPPKRKPSRRQSGEWGDGAYHSLRLDALACLKFGSGRYLNVAILVDPGDISLDGFYHQFRAAYAWRRRPEFRKHRRTFPVFLVIAASEERLGQLRKLCRAAAPRSERPVHLRLTTRDTLRLPVSQRLWRDEHGGKQASAWSALATFERPSLPPLGVECGWWGELAQSEDSVIRLNAPLTLKRKPPGLLKWAAKSKARAARLVRDHRSASVRALALLGRVGQYPLATTGDLAIILGQTHKNVALGLKELLAQGLIDHPNADENGYAPTHHGLALLAAQVGMTPIEYARLRRWPIKRKGREVHYGVGVMLTCRAHSQRVLEFLVGLRRHGPSARLKLLAWDHVQCVHEFPSESPSKTRSGAERNRSDSRRVIPDANGIMRAFGETTAQFADTAFWLEVDRHTEKGAALMNKLARFYHYRLTQPWYRREADLPRLLILVERDDEARLQALRRRLLALNQRWHTELNVRLSRVDLLADGKGKLDPTRKAWRTLESSEFGCAFDRQPPSAAR